MTNLDLSQILLINKPLEWTSFDVVKKVRGILKKKYNISKLKVGHAGTLDPKASGLLVLCVGRKTKQISNFENLDKKYIGVLKLGCVTDSFDSETAEKNIKPYAYISEEIAHNIFADFIGPQQQVPPVFSALKINGERLYKKARRGELDINLKSRSIKIHKLKILEFKLPFIKFEVTCGKGTYIRSLANDIGKKLLCGAYLHELTRTAIGDFKLENARDINEIMPTL